MVEFNLEIVNKDGEVLLRNTAEDEVSLAYRGLYNPGEKIVLTSNKNDIFVVLRLEDSLESSLVYLKSYQTEFEIPFDKERKPYGLKAFTEERHWAWVRIARDYEIETYKNLARNTFDTKDNKSMYPHASTNVVTEDPVFFPRNTIDGVFETSNHGSWPHSSWGINRKKDAWLKIDFGRNVIVDNVVLYLRADFPHDNWWKEADLIFSDESVEHINLQKTGKGQCFKIIPRNVEWIKLSNFTISDEPSEFPALSQIEVYGVEAYE
jgi:hypothetical protein